MTEFLGAIGVQEEYRTRKQQGVGAQFLQIVSGGSGGRCGCIGLNKLLFCFAERRAAGTKSKDNDSPCSSKRVDLLPVDQEFIGSLNIPHNLSRETQGGLLKFGIGNTADILGSHAFMELFSFFLRQLAAAGTNQEEKEGRQVTEIHVNKLADTAFHLGAWPKIYCGRFLQAIFLTLPAFLPL